MPTNNIGISKDVDDIISTLNNKFDSEKGLQLESELKNKLSKFGGGITGSLTISGDLVVDGNINASISGTSENAIKASKDAQGNIIDEHYATKEELNSKFDKSGGEITGTITYSHTTPRFLLKNNTIEKGVLPETDQFTDIDVMDKNGNRVGSITFTADNDGGGYVDLWHHNYNGTNAGILRVGTSTDGSSVCTHNGKNIVRSINNTNADMAGNVSDMSAYKFGTSGNGYIRFTNGLQICWGYINTANGADVTVTYSVAFLAPARISLTRYSGATNTYATSIWLRGNTASNFKVYCTDTETAVNWIAIGPWK